jgi:hypothetical protein
MLNEIRESIKVSFERVSMSNKKSYQFTFAELNLKNENKLLI